MTPTDICNLGLTRLGAKGRIQDLETENSAEALRCREIYDQARRTVLIDFDWGFARRREELTLAVGETAPPHYTHAYVYPQKCLKERFIPVGDDDRIPARFELGIDSTLQIPLIYTAHYPAVLVFTADVETTSIYPTEFIEVLALRIAADVALPLTQKEGRAQALTRAYEQARGRYGSGAMNRENPGPEMDPELVAARR